MLLLFLDCHLKPPFLLPRPCCRRSPRAGGIAALVIRVATGVAQAFQEFLGICESSWCYIDVLGSCVGAAILSSPTTSSALCGCVRGDVVASAVASVAATVSSSAVATTATKTASVALTNRQTTTIIAATAPTRSPTDTTALLEEHCVLQCVEVLGDSV